MSSSARGKGGPQRLGPTMLALALAMAAVATVPALAQTPPATDGIYGVWRNPKDSVHVEIKPCGPEVCGKAVVVSRRQPSSVKPTWSGSPAADADGTATANAAIRVSRATRRRRPVPAEDGEL